MLSYWFLTGALLGNVQNVHCRSTVLRIIPLEILCKYLEYCLFQYFFMSVCMSVSPTRFFQLFLIQSQYFNKCKAWWQGQLLTAALIKHMKVCRLQSVTGQTAGRCCSVLRPLQHTDPCPSSPHHSNC